MTPIALAKIRTSRRRHEAGAVMFVVSMMVTVLAAVGAFALAAAATEMKTAGNERQSAQTHYLAQLGMTAFARETERGNIASIEALAKSNPDTCISLPIPTSLNINTGGKESALATSCRRMSPQDLQNIGQWPNLGTGPNPGYGYATYSGTTPYQAGVTTGSLGPIPITPGYFVEATDLTPRPMPGFSTACKFVVSTVTSYGVTQPVINNTIAYGASGMELQRARVIAGPSGCTGNQ